MQKVRAKKQLGQHFLKDESIALKIVESLSVDEKSSLLEIGPGMGVLTKHLMTRDAFKVVEIDGESVSFLETNFPALEGKIIHGDFLKLNIEEMMEGHFTIIGNFPYNISSQIFFKVLEVRDQVDEVVGMLQREVAQRLASPPGSKVYGILSVLLQAYYDIEYLFTVSETVFDPPPKVKSAVIRLKRNNVKQLDCNERLFKTIVKQSFNQRRKTIRNSVKSLLPESMDVSAYEIFGKRPEQLSVNDFVFLTRLLDQSK